MPDSTYQVKDLYLAAFIYSQKMELVSVDRQGSVCWFIFDNFHKCDELEKLYWSYKGQIVVKQYSDALRTLKDLIFSKH